MVVGATGSGKSTTCNCLENFAWTGSIAYTKTLKLKKKMEEKFETSNQTESKTYTPFAVEIQNEDYMLVDNPGLGENRGFVMNLY